MSTAKFSTWLNPDGTENYKCRAWVNFNGTGTVAIRASGNVSSITDNGTGDYTVNFTTAMPDANYGISIENSPEYGAALMLQPAMNSALFSESAPTASSCRHTFFRTDGATADLKYITVTIIR